MEELAFLRKVAIMATVGAITGFAVGLVGYFGNAKAETFSIFRMTRTLVFSVMGGAIAGAMSDDYKTAMLGAMSGDVLSKAAFRYNETPTA